MYRDHVLTCTMDFHHNWIEAKGGWAWAQQKKRDGKRKADFFNFKKSNFAKPLKRDWICSWGLGLPSKDFARLATDLLSPIWQVCLHREDFWSKGDRLWNSPEEWIELHYDKLVWLTGKKSEKMRWGKWRFPDLVFLDSFYLCGPVPVVTVQTDEASYQRWRDVWETSFVPIFPTPLVLSFFCGDSWDWGYADSVTSKVVCALSKGI